MIPKSTASTATAWTTSGIGLAALLGAMLTTLVATILVAMPISLRAEPVASGQLKDTAPVMGATASGQAEAQAQTLPRVTVVSSKPTPSPTPRVASQVPDKVCRAHEDTLRVLKMVAIEDGVRVEYQFAVSGASTWTNMNRPLLRQFGVRMGGTFCLPHDRNSDMQSARASDAE